MPKQDEDDKNSVCSGEEEIEVKDKNSDDEEEDEVSEEEKDEEEEDDEDEEEDDDEEEFDPTIINFELLKNFFVDEDGNNVATHLGTISKELRTLNKILLKKK